PSERPFERSHPRASRDGGSTQADQRPARSVASRGGTPRAHSLRKRRRSEFHPSSPYRSQQRIQRRAPVSVLRLALEHSGLFRLRKTPPIPRPRRAEREGYRHFGVGRPRLRTRRKG